MLSKVRRGECIAYIRKEHAQRQQKQNWWLVESLVPSEGERGCRKGTGRVLDGGGHWWKVCWSM